MQYLVTEKIEQFYAVEADSAAEAIQICKSGNGTLMPQRNEGMTASPRQVSSIPVAGQVPTPAAAAMIAQSMKVLKQQQDAKK